MVCQSSAIGAHSSSGITERARRPHQHQARTAARPSAYDGHNNSAHSSTASPNGFGKGGKEKKKACQ